MKYQQLLEQAKEEAGRFDGTWQPPCTARDIKKLQERVHAELHAELPKGFIEFLKITDGYNWNSVFVYASKKTDDFEYDFVEMNLLRRDLDWMSDFLIFGSNDMDEFVYQISTREFQTRDRVPFDVVKTFTSFDEMITHVLDENLQPAEAIAA